MGFLATNSNYRQTWPPSQRMNFVVPCIVEVLMNKIALRISDGADGWTAERAIIAGREHLTFYAGVFSSCFDNADPYSSLKVLLEKLRLCRR